MNRTKSFLVAAGFSLAMALTLSCSDDKDEDKDKNGYCLYISNSYAYCIKTTTGNCDFNNICPPGYDSSPKACSVTCSIIDGYYAESNCTSTGRTVMDYYACKNM